MNGRVTAGRGSPRAPSSPSTSCCSRGLPHRPRPSPSHEPVAWATRRSGTSWPSHPWWLPGSGTDSKPSSTRPGPPGGRPSSGPKMPGSPPSWSRRRAASRSDHPRPVPGGRRCRPQRRRQGLREPRGAQLDRLMPLPTRSFTSTLPPIMFIMLSSNEIPGMAYGGPSRGRSPRDTPTAVVRRPGPGSSEMHQRGSSPDVERPRRPIRGILGSAAHGSVQRCTAPRGRPPRAMRIVRTAGRQADPDLHVWATACGDPLRWWQRSLDFSNGFH